MELRYGICCLAGFQTQSSARVADELNNLLVLKWGQRLAVATLGRGPDFNASLDFSNNVTEIGESFETHRVLRS